jgi:hypothetical protein
MVLAPAPRANSRPPHDTMLIMPTRRRYRKTPPQPGLGKRPDVEQRAANRYISKGPGALPPNPETKFIRSKYRKPRRQVRGLM